MPIIYRDNNLLLWRIDESTAELEQLVTESDRASAARLAGAGAASAASTGALDRQRQHLAWRAALRTVVSDGDVEYDANGAPYIECVASSGRLAQPAAQQRHCEERSDEAIQMVDTLDCFAPKGARNDGTPHLELGVSHTKDIAVVIIGNGKCAVDVERTERDVSKARKRFISEAEEQLPDSRRPDFGIAVWCAKEVLYKLAGRRGLDLLRDIAITHSNLAHGRITGTILGGTPIEMRVLAMEQWMIVWGGESGIRDVVQPAAQQRHCEEPTGRRSNPEKSDMLDCFAPDGARNDAYPYPKKYRLAGKKAVDEIFAKGRGGVVHPLRWLVVIEPSEEAELRTLVSVPKKLHKRAVRRNVLKRRMREAVRLNSAELRAVCEKNGVRVSLALLYTTKELLNYAAIAAAVEQILAKLLRKVEK